MQNQIPGPDLSNVFDLTDEPAKVEALPFTPGVATRFNTLAKIELTEQTSEKLNPNVQPRKIHVPLSVLLQRKDTLPVDKVNLPLSQLLPTQIRSVQSGKYQAKTTPASNEKTADKFLSGRKNREKAEIKDIKPVEAVKMKEEGKVKTKPVVRAKKASSSKTKPKAKKGSAVANGFTFGPNDPQLPLVHSKLLLPVRLSPSRAKDFKQCPRLFFYKTILKLPTPPTIATTKGTLAHAVLEMLFTNQRELRTLDLALEYLLPAWTVLCNPDVKLNTVENEKEKEIRLHWKSHSEEAVDKREKDRAEQYQELAAPGSNEETEVLQGAAAAVKGYFTIENPTVFDPVAMELGISARVGVYPKGGDLFGIIDRLDQYTAKSGEIRVAISDYKTGKVPKDMYLDDAFFAMRAYAMMYRKTNGVTPYQLRLLYVSDAKGQASVRSQLVTDELLDKTEIEYAKIWDGINLSAKKQAWNTQTGPLCPWCPFQAICPAFTKEVSVITSETEISLE